MLNIGEAARQGGVVSKRCDTMSSRVLLHRPTGTPTAIANTCRMWFGVFGSLNVLRMSASPCAISASFCPSKPTLVHRAATFGTAPSGN